MTYKHPEAFYLMHYVDIETGETEVLWNSRDGVTPFIIPSRNGGEAKHVSTRERPDRCAVDHVPAVGDRIFVDLTETRARVMAAEWIDSSAHADSRVALEVMYASRGEAIEALAQQAVRSFDGHTPDILVVTAGYIEELQELRRSAPSHPEPVMIEVGAPDIRKHIMGYDRKGRPLTMYELEPLLSDIDYKILARTEINEHTYVSTVWLGIDHNFMGEGPPVIFETMVFRRLAEPKQGRGGHVHEFEGCEQDRYCTEAEALAGHQRMVEAVKRGIVGDHDDMVDAAVYAIGPFKKVRRRKGGSS